MSERTFVDEAYYWARDMKCGVATWSGPLVVFHDKGAFYVPNYESGFELRHFAEISICLGKEPIDENGAVGIAIAALNKLAAWNEGPKVNSSFDDPISARIARRTLLQIAGTPTDDDDDDD